MLYGFADFELDTATLTLRRLSKPMALETASLKRLAHLLQHRDGTVSKEDLLAAGGSHAFSEQAVHNAILEIRKALDDSGKEQRFIQAVRGEGYRFAWQGVCEWKDATERDMQRAALSQYMHVQQSQNLVKEWTQDFVGREFIFNAIDEHIHDVAFPCGYIVIRGEPGIGKTALMAQLIKQHGYVHHFNVALEGIRTARDFLTNVCAQLIVHYHLDAQEAYQALSPEVIKPSPTNSGFLSELLAAVATQQAGRPVVILVDALDEAEQTFPLLDNNRLYLPRSLPEGVFIVVTTRDEDDDRLTVERRRDIVLRDDDPLNAEDVLTVRPNLEVNPRLR